MPSDLEKINRRRAELRACTDEELKVFDRTSLVDTFAVCREDRSLTRHGWNHIGIPPPLPHGHGSDGFVRVGAVE